MSDTGANAKPVIEADSWCRTVAGSTAKTTFMWTIENFNELPEEKEDFIESTKFSVKGPGHGQEITEWSLRLFPKGTGEGADGDDHLFVSLCSHNNSDVKARASLSIVDSSEKEQNICPLGLQTYDVDEKIHSNSWGEDMIKLDELRSNCNLLPDGNLKLLCKLEVFGQAKIYSGSKESFNKTKINDECQKQVINHLENLFTEKNLADLEINCDGEVFNCHHNILSARSPVFSAMFQVDMIENQSKKVNIRDVNKEVFSEVLKFIYTGYVSSEDSVKELARDILAAANKYQLDLLKKLCEAQLVSTLNASNCFDLLILGDLHEAANLKLAALDFVSINSAFLIETEVYKDLFRSQHSDLVFEVTKSMVSKKESNNN